MVLKNLQRLVLEMFTRVNIRVSDLQGPGYGILPTSENYEKLSNRYLARTIWIKAYSSKIGSYTELIIGFILFI